MEEGFGQKVKKARALYFILHCRSLPAADLVELFNTSIPNISAHTSNILKEGELSAHSVIKDYLTTATDDYYTITLPSFVEEPIVDEFREIVYQIPIIIDFDWSHWDEGRKMAQDEHFDYDSVDIPTKCKLITAFVRNDRFCDGALASAFQRGTILKILKAVERQALKR